LKQGTERQHGSTVEGNLSEKRRSSDGREGFAYLLFLDDNSSVKKKEAAVRRGGGGGG